MRYRLQKVFLLLALCTATLWAGAQNEVLFHQDFDAVDGKGGNDQQWSGNLTTKTITDSDFPGWTFQKAYKAKACLKMGTGSEQGKATTPELKNLNGSAIVKLRVGGWDNSSENLELQLSLEGAGSISPTDHKYARATFTEITARIDGGNAQTRLVISAKQTGNNRYFLDDVSVESTTPPRPVVQVNSLEGLRKLAPNTLVRLTFTKENVGRVQAAHGNTEVYVSDKNRSVLLSNFPTEDRGWHPHVGGQLAGVIEGEYIKVGALPAIKGTAKTNGRNILCLAANGSSTATSVTTEQLKDTNLLASFVEMSATLQKEGEQWSLKDEKGSIALVDRFKKLAAADMPAVGRPVQVTAIVGTKEDNTTPALFPLQITPSTVNVVLEGTKDNTLTLQQWVDAPANVTINRHLPARVWSTMVFPFDIEALDESVLSNLSVAEWVGYDSEKQILQFATAHSIRAGEPYLICPKKEFTVLEARGVTLKSQIHPVEKNGVRFDGSYKFVDYSVNSPYILVLGDHPFTAPSEDGKLSPLQGFFQLPNGGTSIQNFSIDGVVRSVTALTSLATDGQEDAPVFNLSGRRVTSKNMTTPGVYLTAGKRLILK